MPTVVRSPGAKRDLEEIMLTIGRDNSSAAMRWFDRAASLFDLLAMQPDVGTIVRGRTSNTVRCISFGSYVVYFHRIDDGVEIFRVLHGARDQTDTV